MRWKCFSDLPIGSIWSFCDPSAPVATTPLAGDSTRVMSRTASEHAVERRWAQDVTEGCGDGEHANLLAVVLPLCYDSSVFNDDLLNKFGNR